ncbi:MAG: 2-C-methyl-D-erythritol 4-phosphate cytidylyltransferase [Crocinitomicaceae bacterium]|nr:2-C-methyl-D-erythritol 4-phosphate cytidylyltransferase [Crocinitomicaceae bacterium]
MSTLSVIITAGGNGKRMGSTLPKQFMLINERPILMYTIEQFYHFDPKAQIILTLPEEWKIHWEKLIQEHDFRIPHRIVSGGERRYDSIKNALGHCYGDYIMVHDGVRPLVNHETLKACIIEVKFKDAVIPIIPINESIRRMEDRTTKAVNREDYVIVQTPQCFKRDVLLNAYDQPYHDGITDDATLVEESGVPIHCVQGNPENIKITTRADLSYAEQLLK